MSIWLFRAGSNGEYEEKFLTENKIYLTWNNLDINLSEYSDREKLYNKLNEIYPTEKSKTLYNWLSQIYPIAHRMQKNDWVVLPSKRTSTIHFGKIVGDYEFNPQNDNPYYHSRK